VSRKTDADAAFDSFVGDAAAGLLRTAFLLTWDERDAEDLVQECLIRVARRWPRVRSMDYPTAYARRVLVNLSLDDAPRRQRRRAELAGSGSAADGRQDDSSARLFGAVDIQTQLLDALGALTRRQRATVVLRYFEDLSEPEVADVLGCSVGTVKSTSSRALERLRQTISRDEEHDADGPPVRRPETERSPAP
jgi:RNA polymerase sigma-70 factor (sigma-E family)